MEKERKMKYLFSIGIVVMLGCGQKKSHKLYVVTHINGPELVKGEEGMCQYVFWVNASDGPEQWASIMDSCGKHQIGDSVIIK